MTRKVFATIFAFALCLGFATTAAGYGQAETQAPDWGLTILSAATAEGEMVLLGDIAQPWGQLPEHSWRQMAATELWAAPRRKGKSYVLSRQRLSSYLNRSLGKLAQRCTLPSGLTIQRGGAVVLRQELETAVREELDRRLSSWPGRVELTKLGLPSTTFLDAAHNHIVVEPMGELLPGRASLRISLRSGDDREIRSLTASTFINHWVLTACAARPINTRETITPEMVEFKEKNLAYARGTSWDGSGGPWRLRRPVGAGQPIDASLLQTVPDVDKGQAVTLLYQGTHIQLKTMGLALADGAVGQPISVRNTRSGKTVQAVIIGPDTVAVR